MSKNADRDRRWYQLFIAGKSFGDIARVEGGDTTKNTVAGAIWRYRMKYNKPGADQERIPEVKKREKPVKRQAEQVKPYHMTMELLGRNECRYPYGDRPDFTFCGHECAPGSSYCPAHHALCNRPAPKGRWGSGVMEGIALQPWRPGHRGAA